MTSYIDAALRATNFLTTEDAKRNVSTNLTSKI